MFLGRRVSGQVSEAPSPVPGSKEETIVTSEDDVRLRAAAGREHRRRRRVFRSLLLLIAMAIGLCVLVIWHRNSVRLAQATDIFEGHLAGLIETFEATGTLPVSYPSWQPDQRPIPPHEFTYIDADMVRCLRNSPEPLIIAYTQQIRQIFGPDLRVVAVREGGRIELQKWPVDRFNRHGIRKIVSRTRERPGFT